MASNRPAADGTTTVVSKAADQTDHPDHRHPQPVEVRTSSPRFNPSARRLAPQPPLAVAVDLSNESAYAVKWAVENYVRPGDTVTLVHVNSTSVLYGADWGSFAATTTIDPTVSEEERDNFTAAKANHLAQPLAEANVPYKIHIVKDHDMKERLCLEVERLGLSALITGSRGAGVLRKSAKGKLRSVSDYCVQHCVCPVVVVEEEEEEEEVVRRRRGRRRSFRMRMTTSTSDSKGSNLLSFFVYFRPLE
ncbi:UNVERIFIED_CONTAM: Universal stress protein PHOS32 [Sesamum angustifolium]|uniref:Universal stress protein PHOS32 n=1 Tax=Sesamum angustifolium TaxID=2727405 RepID=A0AAW2KXU8_9LAMI